jgi:hypothetical protein
MGSYLSTNKSDNKINPENSEESVEQDKPEENKSEEKGMESVEQDKPEENKSEEKGIESVEQDKPEENKSLEIDPVNVTPHTDVIPQKSKKRKHKKNQM